MAAYGTHTDQELVALLRQGDHAAFTEVFNRYSVLMYMHASNKLRNTTEARDVVQDMFINLWARRDALLENQNLAGYLYTLVRNNIFNLIKHKKVVAGYAETFTRLNEEMPAATDELIREKQFSAMIQNEIDALPPRMREVFMMRRMENLSTKEVAERLGLAESTVTDQMKKATRILRSKIGLLMWISMYIIK